MRGLHAGFLAILLLAAWRPVHAVHCLENRDFQQNLPADIGKNDTTGKFTFALQCDTVFVRKGVTTTVYPGAHLYFAKTSLNSTIKVEGTLLLKGSKNSYVYLSGSLDTAKGVLNPGEKPWGGIEISEGGKLVMEFTGMARAPTPITAFSRQVRIVNSFFKGSSGMILPDGSLMAMDSKWHAVNDLDLSQSRDATETPVPETREGGLTKAEKAALLQEQKSDRFWTWPKVVGGAAVLALGVGAGIYLMPGDKEKAPAKELPSTMDGIPELPDHTKP